MRLEILMLLAAAVLCPPAARGAEALYLSWNECPLDAGSAPDILNACVPADVSALYIAFQPPDTLDGVLALEIVIDVQHSEPVMPDWWQFGAGGCMEGALVADADFTLHVACADPWQGAAGAVVQGYAVGEPRGQPNQARIKVVAVVPAADAVALMDETTYYAARLRFPGSNACAGCGSAACLVLNSILVRRLPGHPGGDVMIVTPAPGNGNWSTWQGSTADCSMVPVARSSWGQIKALYR